MLFDFSVEEVKEAGWNLVECTYDLHSDERLNEGNVMTEYEKKFYQMFYCGPFVRLIFRAIFERKDSRQKEVKEA